MGSISNEIPNGNGNGHSSPTTRSTHQNGSNGHAADRDTAEAIAVIGMSCRLPGGCDEPSKLWDLLTNAKSAWSPVPAERFNMNAFHDPANPHAGTTNTSGGHFLTGNVAAFDAAFFGISPLEAAAIDPQQRHLLEIAYDAFENAGLTLNQLWGSNTGAYVGQWSSDYAEVLARDPEYPALYHTTGIGQAISSNRISYFFNLRGPSFTVDTGCSASLVALHNAVQSLRSGETSMSFVGGVNLLLDPQRFTYQSKLKMFSPDGRSFSFDSRANGYGRGEGCCGVVLKPLKAALRDNDRIRAVIRNTALNQDGRTAGISVPSGKAQEEAIKAAYAGARLDITPDYVEAHGTGTSIGDPIEARAIAEVLSMQRSPVERPLPVGSIKGNIGHTESAAGLAGLVKSILMLENQAIPPQVNYKSPNPKVLLDAWNLQIPVQLEQRELCRISINSFGYGGTNAHVVLDRAADLTSTNSLTPIKETERLTKYPRAFILSADDGKGCQVAADRLAAYVTQHAKDASSSLWMDRLAYSLCRRTVHRHRAAVIAYDSEDLLTQLTVLAESPVPAKVNLSKPKVAYIFSGQGAQYYNMGRELINNWPVFQASMEQAHKTLLSLGCSWDPFVELLKDADLSRLDDPAFGQPMSTALQLSLVDTLAALGVTPSVVVGHSSGEIAAAYAAGALSFADAMSVSYHRGRLTSELIANGQKTPGAMLAVGLPAEVAETYMANLGMEPTVVKIACYNSPSNVTLSGDKTALERLAETFEDDGVFNRMLRTNGAAYHSEHMRQIEQQYYEALKDIQPHRNSIRMVSSVTGQDTGAAVLGREYWVNNLVSPVRFADATKRVFDGGDASRDTNLILEIGAHSQLAAPIKQILQKLHDGARDVLYACTLKRKANAAETLLQCLAELFSAGLPLDITTVNCGFHRYGPQLLSDLPPYPFNHAHTHWHESRLSKDYKNRQFLPHELLGNLSVDVNNVEPRWRRYLREKELPWLQHHRVQNQTVFPAAGYLTMALEGARRHKLMQDSEAKITSFAFRNVSIGKALIISNDSSEQEISLSLRPEPRTARDSWNQWMEFRVFTAASDRAWTEHCRGRLRVNCETREGLHNEDLEAFVDEEEKQRIVGRSQHHISPKRFYTISRELGLAWAMPFSNLVHIQTSGDTTYTVAETPNVSSTHSDQTDQYVIHPATLDSSLFHGICCILFMETKVGTTVVPTFIKNLVISANTSHLPGSRLNTYAYSPDDGLTYNVMIGQNVEGGEKLLLRGDGLVTSKIPGISTEDRLRNLCHESEWVPYCETMTSQRRTALYGGGLEDSSIAEHNRHLSATALVHIHHALNEVTSDQVAEGYQQHYYDWLRVCAETACDSIAPPGNEEKIDFDVGLEAVNRVGSNLPGLLTGAADPIEIMQQNELLSNLYAEDRCERCYRQIQACVTDLGVQNPGLKVLEIGAGTASASIPILQTARNGDSLISRYDFTDVSSGFLLSAEEKLADFSRIVNYSVLDIERPPHEQGFEEGTYDIVVACNVIHATRNVSDSIRHARALLRPGGTFILMEITKDQLYYNLIFGAFPGWWIGAEDGRKSSPLLSDARWTETLTAAGFCDAEPCFADYEGDEAGSISIFVAKAADAKLEIKPSPVHIIGDVENAGYSLPDLCQHLSKLLNERDVSFGTLSDGKAASDTILICLPEICEALATSIDEQEWEQFQSRLYSHNAVLLLTYGGVWDCPNPNGATTIGLARCLRLEQVNSRYVTLDLDPNTENYQDMSQVISTLLLSPSFNMELDSKDVDSEFAERSGQLYVNRVFHAPGLENHIKRATGRLDAETMPLLQPNRPMKVELGVPGLLETFRWVDDPLTNRDISPDEVRVELRAASINFRDVLVATGQVESLVDMKNDCSGIVVEVGQNMSTRYKKGDRVCCYYAQSYNSYPLVHGDCCALIPDPISFEVAASLPIVWATAYYALIDVGRLQKSETVLIHSGAGAVGQASIMLARYVGAEIFATAGSDDKRAFLVKEFGIPPSHVLSSRTTAFKQQIKDMTGGKGVDVILNSLSGELFRESCETLAAFGRFVEIGKKDFLDDALMPTKFLLRNITFACVDLTLMIDQDKSLVKRLLNDVVGLIASGAVQPTTVTTMPISEIEKAFRTISAGKHVGKIILTVAEDQLVKALPQAPKPTHLHADSMYVIVGGLGGLGQSIITWMAACGAKHILTLSRSGANAEGSAAFIEEMKSRGVSVIAKQCDVASRQQLGAVLSELADDGHSPPIKGLIHSAMALEDATFDNMTYGKWQKSLRPKVLGSWNLHDLLPPDIDFFILLSSIVAISGHVGQSNYAAACSFQDAFAHYLCSRGRPAYSINIGPVSDAGFVSENAQIISTMRRQGFGAITTSDVLAHLDYVVTEGVKNPNTSCQGALGLVPGGGEAGLGRSDWIDYKGLQHLARRAHGSTGASNSDTAGTDGFNYMEAIRDCKTPEDAEGLVCQAILEQLARLIGAPVESLTPTRTLDSYGVDSLVAVELRNWIGAYLQSNITLLVVREAKSINQLAKDVTTASRLVSQKVRS